jgi:hypothetical protein
MNTIFGRNLMRDVCVQASKMLSKVLSPNIVFVNVKNSDSYHYYLFYIQNINCHFVSNIYLQQVITTFYNLSTISLHILAETCKNFAFKKTFMCTCVFYFRMYVAILQKYYRNITFLVHNQFAHTSNREKQQIE